jgi:ferrous iron transport protein B
MSTAVPDSATKTLTVALIGNPNTGKSTLFNGLTNGKARIGNFPGVTVEKKVGSFRHAGQQVQLVDLPGTYSLAPRSADEMVSVDVLLGRQRDVGAPDAVVCIADASNLERNLYLFSQIRDLGIPVLLVLNMWDLAQGSGVQIDLAALQKRLGVNIVTCSAHRRENLPAIRDEIIAAACGSRPAEIRLFPEQFYAEAAHLQDWLSEQGAGDVPFFLRERMLLDVHGESEHRASLKLAAPIGEYLSEARGRLAAAGFRIPLIETRVRYDWIRRQLDGVVQRTLPAGLMTPSDRIDRILTHRVWGLLLFALVMFLVFQAIYSWASPFMDAVEALQGEVAQGVAAIMPVGTLRSLLIDGIIAGVGSVLVFLPQIILLFTFIALMEDCGYMARAAFLMDKLMTRVGLSGKSFLPLMSSFACAIPGVMATRVIENRRDRMITILVAPLMSCSARLPVYLLMVAAFIPSISWLGGWVDLKGVVLFSMYALGAVVAVPVAWILKKTFFRGETPPFVMELPPYKFPSVRIVFDRVYDRARAFVLRAGSLIFCVTVLIWAAGYFPGDHTRLQNIQLTLEQTAPPADEPPSPERQKLQEEADRLSSQLIRESYLGRFGRAIEPAVAPLGWDWRIGVGALASFPAREVIIATLGTIFSLGGEISEGDTRLVTALQSATWPNGAPLFTIPVALSVMVFFALCAQCAATLMVIRRETNSWRWPAFTFFYMTALAYVGALVCYQVGTWLAG